MDNEKIGKFLKSLREEMKWSQEQLASKMFVDRTLISKWENGKILPDVNRLIELSNIFNVKLEDILAGERRSNNNKDSEKEIKKYLLFQNSKNRKLKIFIIRLIILVIFLATSFFTYYFFQNYNKIKVYKIYGTSENYELNNGIFLVSREKMYFNLGKLYPESSYINLYYFEGNKKIVIYDGDPTNVLIDYYNFDALFNKDKIEETLNNLYLEIYKNETKKEFDTMKLNYSTNFQNDSLLYHDKQEFSEDNIDDFTKNIPDKILKEFECSYGTCTLTKNNLKIAYEYASQLIFISTLEYEIKYDLITKDFSYDFHPNNERITKFKIVNNSVFCEVGNCENAQNIFNDF